MKLAFDGIAKVLRSFVFGAVAGALTKEGFFAVSFLFLYFCAIIIQFGYKGTKKR
ncbi:MAG: hypothetical protein MJZ36_11290 [Bacteroidaceae bacterium]|nr:hypothetical protein [Bacteroidaceae bacterium]